MTFSECHLGKSLDQFNFEVDVEPFIRKETPEGQNLEYKSRGSALSEHGDVISAFLNSGGGLLIVGAPTEVDITLPGGKTAKVCRGPFTPLPATSKDDARRSLISKVTPVPIAVRVNPVPCPGGCVIAVDVDSSNYPPHQHDGSYWIRLDGETRRAPHALVEALFLQRRGPNLECHVVLKRSLAVDSPDALDRWKLEMQLVVRNNSRNIAEYVAVDLKTDRLLAQSPCQFHPTDPQPGDELLPTAFDEEERRLVRYRLRADVMYAYSWKAFVLSFEIARSYDQGRHVKFAVDLQAKDMLRKRYEYDVLLDFPYRRDHVVEPERVDFRDTASP